MSEEKNKSEEYKYKILDCDGIEMPRHYSGRLRTYEEAVKIVNDLNKKGEYTPYTFEKL